MKCIAPTGAASDTDSDAYMSLLQSQPRYPPRLESAAGHEPEYDGAAAVLDCKEVGLAATEQAELPGSSPVKQNTVAEQAERHNSKHKLKHKHKFKHRRKKQKPAC